MAYSDASSRRIGCVIFLALGLGLTILWLDWLDEPPYHDATSAEVAKVAAKCGAVVSHFGPTTFMDPPTVSMTIDVRSMEEFMPKATCIDRELKALDAFSLIGGPNGEDLLVSDGIDRIY